MKKKENRNQGFSLIEILVAITVLTIVVVPLVGNLITSSKINGRSKSILKATEMTQNIFEGITAVDPENAIVDLSGKSETPGDLLVFPNSFTYENIVEYNIPLDTSTNKPQKNADGTFVMTPTSGASYVISNVTAADGSKRYSGLAESDSKVYAYAISGIKQLDQYYDLRVTFDASEYNAAGNAALEKRAKISGLESYDCVFPEGVSVLDSVVMAEYCNKRIKASLGKTPSQVLQNLERTYTIDVKKVSDVPNREVTVEVTTDYLYKNSADLAMGADAVFVDYPQQIYTSTEYGVDPRNIFIYYTPNYYSKTVGGELDHFVINNPDDLNVNVYIVRTQQGSETVFGMDNKTDTTKEQTYAATVAVTEADSAEVNTKIRTNLSDNITVESLTGRRRVPDKIAYSYNGTVPGDILTMLDVNTLDAPCEENRMYNVTVEVYKGKTDNGSYAGACAAGFPEKDRLAKFEGCLVH